MDKQRRICLSIVVFYSILRRQTLKFVCPKEEEYVLGYTLLQ